MYACSISFIRPSLGGHVGCFHGPAVVNSAAVNLGVPVSFHIIVLSRYTPRSGIVGSYVKSVFHFLGRFCVVVHSGCTSLFSHQ